jgi:hypothetical protein
LAALDRLDGFDALGGFWGLVTNDHGNKVQCDSLWSLHLDGIGKYANQWNPSAFIFAQMLNKNIERAKDPIIMHAIAVSHIFFFVGDQVKNIFSYSSVRLKDIEHQLVAV